MAYRIVWSERASEDILAILRYYRRRNPKVAKEICIGIYERTQILENHPESGRILEELDDPKWRRLIYRSWKIVYEVSHDDRVIAIACVWHAARGEVDI
jgi:toxin ParE1/3/4